MPSSLIQNRRSDVYMTETDLSAIVINTSTSTAGEVIVSSMGPTDVRLYNSYDGFRSKFGDADPFVSFTGYTARDYFREGNQLYAARAVGSGARYAAIALLRNQDTTLEFKPITGGVADPTNPDWNTFVTGTQQCVGLFYPDPGPGSYADNYAVQFVTKDPSTPTGINTDASDTGGVLVAGTYEYVLSSFGQSGETLASNPVTVVIAGGVTTGSIKIGWNLMPNAYGYYLYGRSSSGSGMGLIAQIGQGTQEFVDTGELVPDMSQKPITDPALAAKPSGIFTVNFYDTSINGSVPQESWDVSFFDSTDGTGTTTEMESRVNSFSSMMRYNSNLGTVIGTVNPQNLPVTNLAGGTSGAAPTSFTVANVWTTKFANRNLVPVRTLINGGVSDPVAQRAMDSLAQKRGDCVAMLDTPSDQQQAQQAINYRRAILNLNSNYSAIFSPDVLEADDRLQRSLLVPFSGWAAALCARTDKIANPAFSIAGLNRGLLDILGTRYTYEEPEMDNLEAAQVNYVRTLLGAGTALWEQRTLQNQASALSWLSVRRIANTIKTSMYFAGLYYLQEQNDEFTVRAILKTYETYLTSMVTARALSDFALVSDERNNTADMEIAGVRKVLVVLYPTIPIHELDLDFAITKRTVTVDEVVQTVG